MLIQLQSTHYQFFVISSSAGAATDADTLPTCAVYEDNISTAIVTPTVTKISGGLYVIPIACTTVNGFEAGKSYNAVVSATVGGTAAKAVVTTFKCSTYGVDEIYADTHTTGVKLKSGELDGVTDAIAASDTTINQILTNLGSVDTDLGALADVVAGIYQDTHTDGVKISDGNLVEGSLNIKQVLAEMFAMLLGIIIKSGDNYTIKNPAGTATRATIVTDGNGNRTSVTLSPPA